jgi:hypothetical protein
VKFTNRAFDWYVKAVYDKVPVDDDKGDIVGYERYVARCGSTRGASVAGAETDSALFGKASDGTNP